MPLLTKNSRERSLCLHLLIVPFNNFYPTRSSQPGKPNLFPVVGSVEEKGNAVGQTNLSPFLVPLAQELCMQLPSLSSGEALQKVGLLFIHATFSGQPNVHAHEHRELKLQMRELCASQHRGERVVPVERPWPWHQVGQTDSPSQFALASLLAFPTLSIHILLHPERAAGWGRKPDHQSSKTASSKQTKKERQ